ncbi:hypothetical protein EDB83DRAFT_2405923, partial [Lactarius deliciosus]
MIWSGLHAGLRAREGILVCVLFVDTSSASSTALKTATAISFEHSASRRTYILFYLQCKFSLHVKPSPPHSSTMYCDQHCDMNEGGRRRGESVCSFRCGTVSSCGALTLECGGGRPCVDGIKDG